MTNEEKIIKNNLEYSLRYYGYCKEDASKNPDIKYIKEKRTKLPTIVTSSNVQRRILLSFDEEKTKMLSARVLVRSVINRCIIASNHEWAKRTIEGVAYNKEQIFKWNKAGLENAYEWLESKGVKEPYTLPSESNVDIFSKQVTAVWLMHTLNGELLHRTLKDKEFTIPLIASELVRLKY